MTIKEARKLLRDEGNGVTDEQILKDIETAEFFKELFFDQLLKGKLYIKIAK